MLARPQPLLSDDLTARLVERLMDVSLPKPPEPREDEEPPGSPGEYEPPDAQVGDWTDPFFGLERPLVGGLAPGQAVPGIGDQASDEADDAYWRKVENEAEAHAPFDDWADRGGELFEEWDANRGGN